MRNLLIGIGLFTLAQSLIWFQTNGQFIWPFFKKNPLVISIIGGTLISYIFIKGTWLVAQYYEGLLWPGRFLGQATGIVIFAFMTFIFLNEGLTLKTTISLILASILIGIQIFWK